MVESPQELREKAEHYRSLARQVTDPQAIQALQDLAAQYDAETARLEAKAASN
jgi:hypothetical protein